MKKFCDESESNSYEQRKNHRAGAPRTNARESTWLHVVLTVPSAVVDLAEKNPEEFIVHPAVPPLESCPFFSFCEWVNERRMNESIINHQSVIKSTYSTQNIMNILGNDWWLIHSFVHSFDRTKTEDASLECFFLFFKSLLFLVFCYLLVYLLCVQRVQLVSTKRVRTRSPCSSTDLFPERAIVRLPLWSRARRNNTNNIIIRARRASYENHHQLLIALPAWPQWYNLSIRLPPIPSNRHRHRNPLTSRHGTDRDDTQTYTAPHLGTYSRDPY